MVTQVIKHVVTCCESAQRCVSAVVDCVPLVGVECDSSWAVSEDGRRVAAVCDVAAAEAEEETEPFGGL